MFGRVSHNVPNADPLPLKGVTPLSKRSARSAVTFEGGLAAPFHRWFRLTPSFSPDLVSRWIEQHFTASEGTLLDPFSGAGTTCIVGKSRGLDVVGFEINPLLAFVSETCLDWSISPAEIHEAARRAIESARDIVQGHSGSADLLAESLGTTVPPIHNVTRWWRDDVLRKLVALRYAIEKHGGDAAAHLNLAMAQIVYSTANITLGRLQVAFVDRSTDTINVFDPFEEMIDRIVEDLTSHVPQLTGTSRVYNADSRELAELEDGSISAVFTSPPYPNRYSYVWNTRPHLYLLGFFTTPKQAADLDLKTIGGTWGTATSILQKGRVEPSASVEQALSLVIERLHVESTLMGNYVTKYFNEMDRHLQVLGPKLKPGAPVGYVVGNTETKGIMIEVHDVLAELFERNGFGRIEQDHLRARNSGAGLTEVTVSARKN